MTRIDLGRIGTVLNVSADNSYLDDAVAMEKLGYSAIWLRGGQLDTLERIAKVVRATSVVSVAAAIIPLDVYGWEAVVSAYGNLEVTHPGRFVVGLGGPQQVAKPLAALNEFVDHLDAADPPVPADRRVLAALGPRKLDLARERFAGAIPVLVTPEYTADARRILGEDSTLIVEELVVLDTDPSRAREIARGTLRFLAGVRGYAANFRRMGFGDDDIEGLSDRLVDALVPWGDADAIAARVRAQLDAGADQVALLVLNRDVLPDRLAGERELAEQLIGKQSSPSSSFG